MQTNSPPKLASKTMLTPPKLNILVFSTHIPTFHLNALPFCHELTKITQTKSNKGQEKIDNQGNTKQFNSIENRDNSPYEEQQLPLRTTKGKNKLLFL